MDIGKAPTFAEVSKYKKRAAEKRDYDAWEKWAWKILNDYLWLMRKWKELAPKSADEKFDKRFVYALHHLDYAEYLCLEFINCNNEDRLLMKEIISAIADFQKL